MKKFKILVICAFVTAFITANQIPAQAGNDGRMAAAYELIDQAGLIDKFIITCDMMTSKLADQMFKNDPKTAPYSDVLAGALKEAINETLAEPQVQTELKQMFATIYMEEFNEKELKDIAAFYKTPTGKKSLEKLPAVIVKSQQRGQQFAARIIKASLEEKLTAKLEQLQKEGKIPAKKDKKQ
ncbi:DUF2059 domain-containing protein [Maridesulfovibrio sp.]|uniref:DUF2059 domain-containing protein n=1 Tax=Maridesulfovibrio sp. TaxID=2795000 RepID=UPI002A1883CE|nr:DUF2059 domain-containing protein [Maridesulfovibrio sp.]